MTSLGKGKLQFHRFEIDVPIYRQANATKQIYKAWIRHYVGDQR